MRVENLKIFKRNSQIRLGRFEIDLGKMNVMDSLSINIIS